MPTTILIFFLVDNETVGSVQKTIVKTSDWTQEKLELEIRNMINSNRVKDIFSDRTLTHVVMVDDVKIDFTF